jgi:hypothetical protein
MFNEKFWTKTIAISNYQVMKSAAGYYIGRSSVEETSSGDRYPAPYDRASGYYATEEAAKKDLPKYKEVQ